MMPTETTPSRKEKNKYTIVFVPSDQSKKSRSFSAYSVRMIGAVSIIIALIVAGVLGIIIYTPLGAYLPITSPELERLYGKKVVQIQGQLSTLAREVAVLQEYNKQLRDALGENEIAKGYESDSESANNTKNPQRRSQLASVESFKGNKTSPREWKRDQEKTVVINNFSELKAALQVPLSVPVVGYESRGYNDEQHHYGVDFVAKEGSPVFAAANGTVIYADWTYDDGYTIILAHNEGCTTVYKHNQVLLKQWGAVVKRGEPIALVGNTGHRSSGPHLHFEVWDNGVTVDPVNYLITLQ